MRLKRVGRWFLAIAILAVAVIWLAAQTWTLSPTVNLVMTAVTLAIAVTEVVLLLGEVRAMRRLGERGRVTTAIIESVSERHVQIPSGYSGWVTGVTVRFTNTEGESIRAHYTDYARAGGKEAGQSLPIAYDPDRPSSISPLGDDTELDDPRFVNVFLAGVGVVGTLGIAGYFAYHGLR